MVQPKFRSKNASHESHPFEVASQADREFLALRNDDHFAGGIGVQVSDQLPINAKRSPTSSDRTRLQRSFAAVSKAGQVKKTKSERDKLWLRGPSIPNVSATDTAFVFRLRYQIRGARRRCERAILFAHVAIE